MKLTMRNILTLSIITVAGLTGSVVVGLMRHGGSVFDTTALGFSFVSFGLSGAFIFAFYHVRGLSETITSAVVVSAIQFGVASTWITVSTAAIWSFGVNLPVVALAFMFEKKMQTVRRARFAIVGLLYGTMFVLLTLFVGLLMKIDQMPPVLFRDNFIDGGLIGLGLGIGIQAGEAFTDALEHRRLAKA